MHPDMKPKAKNAITMDATRTISKWLNEEPNTPIDREALATVLARVGFLELETEALRNSFEAMLERTAGIEQWLGGALNHLQHANASGNFTLNQRPTHYSSEPYIAAPEVKK